MKKKRKTKRKKVGRPKEIKKLSPLELKRMNRGWNKTVVLVCSKCNRKMAIHTDTAHLPLYISELRKNWVCMFCRHKGKGRKVK